MRRKRWPPSSPPSGNRLNALMSRRERIAVRAGPVAAPRIHARAHPRTMPGNGPASETSASFHAATPARLPEAIAPKNWDEEDLQVAIAKGTHREIVPAFVEEDDRHEDDNVDELVAGLR